MIMTQMFETVLKMSLEAGVLALLIIGARALIKCKQAIVLTVLFAMLIAKLILPLSVQSPLSIQNLLQAPKTSPKTETVQIVPKPAEPQADMAIIQIAEEVNLPANLEKPTNHSQIQNTNFENLTQQTKAWQPTLIEIAAVIWFLGIMIMSVYIVLGNIRFMRKLKRNRTYSTLEFDTLLSEYKQDFNIKQNIKVIRISEIQTAAVYGVFKPKLLISPHTFETLSLQEKRHVMMHELSHIKRRDTLLCLVMTILNIIHWFNPIVWVAFMLLRKDIEIMCDAKVLQKIGQCERQNYAKTLLNLFTKTDKNNVRLATALFMSNTSIKSRIMMIAKYKKRTPIYTVLGLVLALIIAVTGCTTSVQEVAEEADLEESEVTVQETEAAPETDDTIISKLELITTHSFDFSSYADDPARVENIRKASHLFNKTIIKLNEDNHFIYNESITAEKGWMEAPALSWKNYINIMEKTHWTPQASDTKEFETMQIGGGLDLVFGAIYKAFSQANIPDVELGFFEDDFFKGGDLVISNGNTDIILQTTIEDDNLIVEIFGKVKLVSSAVTAEIEPELMTSFTLDYRSHKDTASYDNVKRALNLLDGTIIEPGEILSINSILGLRTQANGWKAAPGIVNGRYTQQYGGGVSAVSSALYNAAIRSELEIVERHAHAFPSAYVPEGMDATISTGGPDLVIRNPYNVTVKIQAKWEGGLVTIDIYGPPLDHTIDFTSYKVKTSEPSETIYYYNTTETPDGNPIPPDQAVQWVKPINGTTWKTYKIILDTDGKEITKSLFNQTTYKAFTGVVYVNGPDPAEAK